MGAQRVGSLLGEHGVHNGRHVAYESGPLPSFHLLHGFDDRHKPV